MTEDEDIVDVEVEEVGVVPRLPKGAAPSSATAADADETIEDIPFVEAERAEPASPPPTAAPPEKRLRPPGSRVEFVLRVLIAVALAVLVYLGVYLFRGVAPERYADFRALFPAAWRFPPPATPGMILYDQG